MRRSLPRLGRRAKNEKGTPSRAIDGKQAFRQASRAIVGK
jgi:hypothetical protein